ncbi:hypothetical protein [Yersinia similis]|uniref:hypothetical protein n=1 Tax=Yersinia similis TaxID=367190 RepID=UPI0005E9B216|nr:hypothetical protein [Yersinia similis]CNB33219.1 Uncharacterised protein [Yersinia similis]CNE68413.1 Uncharacterised protein [Yersinia similis]
MGYTYPAVAGSQQNDKKNVEIALASLKGTAVNFAVHSIKEARVREQYLNDIRKMSQEFTQAVDSGSMTSKEAALKANTMRNHILNLSRLKSSPVGRAYAMSLKREGKTMSQLTEHYATRLYRRPFNKLSEGQQASVFKEIVQASGRDRGAASSLAKGIGVAGQRIIFISFAVAAYEIYQSEDKTAEIFHQGALATAGVAGGWAAGAGVVAAGVCVATAPMCVGVAAITGGILAAAGTEMLYGTILPTP